MRSGNLPAAEVAFARLVERSSTSTTEWARGIEAAARALLSEGPDAEAHYLEAVDQLGRSRVIVLHARAQLTYGEWLRREGRRVDARAQLKAALSAFETMGADGFADRARRELLATGEKVRKRTDDTRGDLTPQEAQIARLASDRLTNPEIAAQLYLSPRTVEYHLHKVFQKLGISSRRELANALSALGRSRSPPDARCGTAAAPQSLVSAQATGPGHPTEATDRSLREPPAKRTEGGDSMTRQSTTQQTELAQRASDGIEVTLVWAARRRRGQGRRHRPRQPGRLVLRDPGRATPRPRRLLSPIRLPGLRHRRRRRQPSSRKTSDDHRRRSRRRLPVRPQQASAPPATGSAATSRRSPTGSFWALIASLRSGSCSPARRPPARRTHSRGWSGWTLNAFLFRVCARAREDRTHAPARGGARAQAPARRTCSRGVELSPRLLRAREGHGLRCASAARAEVTSRTRSAPGIQVPAGPLPP